MHQSACPACPSPPCRRSMPGLIASVFGFSHQPEQNLPDVTASCVCLRISCDALNRAVPGSSLAPCRGEPSRAPQARTQSHPGQPGLLSFRTPFFSWLPTALLNTESACFVSTRVWDGSGQATGARLMRSPCDALGHTTHREQRVREPEPHEDTAHSPLLLPTYRGKRVRRPAALREACLSRA